MRWVAGILLGWLFLGAAMAHADLPTLVAALDPQGVAAQAKEFGLFLPNKLNDQKPLVLLIHGLDMDQSSWQPTADQLRLAGYPVAWFCYPQDQPIADDIQCFTQHMISLRKDSPKLTIDIIAFSMGSLVARGYVEDRDYAGGVDRMILLAPPNHGSTWARYAVLLKIKQHLYLSMNDPAWRPSWFFTSGLCQADDDLLPGSTFLTQLNSLPRRDGVRYTIIEGDQHVFRRITADAVQASADWIAPHAASCQCLQSLKSTLVNQADAIRSRTDKSDGPVTLNSADLPGVTDIVRIHCDHQKMIDPADANPPLAWDTIRDRLDDKVDGSKSERRTSNFQRPTSK
jgi:pimeloyl-ACP methyl ester carboxylesterase